MSSRKLRSRRRAVISSLIMVGVILGAIMAISQTRNGKLWVGRLVVLLPGEPQGQPMPGAAPTPSILYEDVERGLRFRHPPEWIVVPAERGAIAHIWIRKTWERRDDPDTFIGPIFYLSEWRLADDTDIEIARTILRQSLPACTGLSQGEYETLGGFCISLRSLREVYGVEHDGFHVLLPGIADGELHVVVRSDDRQVQVEFASFGFSDEWTPQLRGILRSLEISKGRDQNEPVAHACRHRHDRNYSPRIEPRRL